jgi:Transglycosylase SLT domain
MVIHGVARAGEPAAIADDTLCLSAIRTTERAMHLPAKLLGAIGLVESGRVNPQTHTVAPWPWTINVGGAGQMFATKQDAIAAVQAAQAAGAQSIDVGCMQVNLMHHPDAFATLDQAFDPQTNTNWAAGFLTRLHAQTNDWPTAAAAYHSMTPEVGADYADRVAVFWPLAASAGTRLGQAPTVDRAIFRVDPHGVLTPEFRARLIQDAAFRTARNVAMGLIATPPHSATIILAQRHGLRAQPKMAASRMILQASLRDPTGPAAR